MISIGWGSSAVFLLYKKVRPRKKRSAGLTHIFHAIVERIWLKCNIFLKNVAFFCLLLTNLISERTEKTLAIKSIFFICLYRKAENLCFVSLFSNREGLEGFPLHFSVQITDSIFFFSLICFSKMQHF